MKVAPGRWIGRVGHFACQCSHLAVRLDVGIGNRDCLLQSLGVGMERLDCGDFGAENFTVLPQIPTGSTEITKEWGCES